MAAAAGDRMVPPTTHPKRDVAFEEQPRQRGRGRWARYGALLFLSGLASCTGSPATFAVPPNFEITTPAGVAGVCIRTSPPGMTDAEFTHMVRTGMERETDNSIMAPALVPPLPTRRIVWHVNQSPPNPVSRLVANVFDGRTPFAYEQETISNDTPKAAITAAVKSMSERLMTKIASHASVPDQPNTQVG
jgi:hypothetical protein